METALFNHFPKNKLTKLANLVQFKHMFVFCLEDWGAGLPGPPCVRHWRQKRKDAAADDEDTNSKRHTDVMQLCRRQYKRLFYRLRHASKLLLLGRETLKTA